MSLAIKTKQRLMITIVIILMLIVGVFVVVKHNSSQKDVAWNGFQQYTNSLQPTTQAALYKNTYTTGCYEGDTAYENAPFCSFYNNRFYVLEGDFRKTAIDIRNRLEASGYRFSSDNIKYHFVTAISNMQIADNLSNRTPLLGVFVNDQRGIEARLIIGDKKRVKPAGLPSNVSSTIPDQQLTAVLTFSQDYK